ncbi:protein MAIN-LIKE 2-like [Abrus precatorius]|uniref:Protein MAIN-LIKE 2-like n=1 Tax=Abrus precatorius TaxID=3816 RepID=A0A8B8M8E8_ABRPR|nr:protein MAIN-LIKE 2-like [Abrus precatorius]
MASSSSWSKVLNPGSEDGSLLKYQSVHVSEHIWDGREHLILKVRMSHFIPAGMEGVPMEILPHLTLAGFAGVAQLDIAIQIGLHIDGKTVIAAVGGNKAQIVEDLFGIRPPDDAFAGSSLKLSGFMLADHFSSRVPVRYLPLLEDFIITGEYIWGAAALAFLYQM